MSFESTGKLRKAQNKDGFEATEKFSRNEEQQRKAETEKLNKINGIINKIDSRTQKLFNDYSATAEEKAKFVSGEASTYDNPMKYKPKFTSKSYVDEANSIKSYIEENKDYLSGEQYLAAMQNVNAFLDTDFTDSDKAWNEYYNAVQKSGGKENFDKAVEEYREKQATLKKAGLNKNSTYAQIEGVVNDTSTDAGAGPLEQAQGRAYKDRRLSTEEKDYLRNLLKTEEKVSTMTTDEVISRVEKISKNNSEESVKSTAEKMYSELTSNGDDWKKLEYINNLRLKDPIEITDDERTKETEYSVYLREKYGIYDYSQNLKEQIEQKVRNDNKSAETAYYYTENGETKAMTWGNYLNERTAGEAYKSVTDDKSSSYNPEAAEIYNRLSQLDDFYIKTEGMTNPQSADSLYKERENLNKRFEELTGTTFDAVEDYQRLQASKAKSEAFTNTIDSVMEKLDNLPKWISVPLNIASGNVGGIASDIVGLIDENAGDVVKTVTGTIGLRPSVEGAAMVMSIPGAVLSGLDYVGNAVGNIGHNDPADYKNYRQLNIYNDYATLWAQQVSGKGQDMFRQDLLDLGLSEKTANNIARIGYGGVSSGLNSIAVIATSCALFGEEAGSVIGMIILSGQAASSTTHEAINNGSTAGEALMSGFAAGVAEYIGEKVSLGYFFDNILHGTMSAATVKEFFKSAGKWALGSVIEGSEEVFTSAMNRFADYIINSDHSNMELAVQNYISQGYSAEEAKNKAANDWWTETFYDFWGGFVGGSLMGGAALAGNVAVNTKNKIQDTARQADIGKAITGTDAGKNVLELAEKRGLDTSKAAKEVSEGRGIGKLVSKVRNAVRNRNMGKLAQDVVETELKAAKETAMPTVGDENLAELVAEIATGTADVGAISVLAANGVLTDENANKIFEALEAVQERTENAEVRNMINDIVETAESTEGKAYNANNIYGIKREGGKTKYILEDGTEVDSGEFGLTSKDKTLFVNAVKNMTDAEANEMISAYRKYADGTDEGVFATTWGLYRSLGETGAAKNSERMAGYKSRIYFTDDAEVNNVLVASAIEQGVKARAQNEKKVNIKARAERVIEKRGRAKGEVRGEEHLGKNKSGAKTVSRTLAKLGYDVEFLSEDSKLRGKRIGDTKINGAYDAETNTIYLRADAEYNASDVRGILGHTLAHEITHSIKVWSESDYNVLTDYIRDALGADFDALVKQKMNALGTDYGMATDEVIADGCEMLLRDSKALEKLAAENANLFVKIASKIKEFITKLRKAQADMYGGNEELHDSALRLREALKSLEEVQEVFDNALENSIRNMRNALAEAENAKAKANLDVLEKAAQKEGLQLPEEEQNNANTEKISEETNGKIEFDAKTDSVSPAFSEETWRESDYVQHRNEAAKALSAALGVSKAKALKYIDDVNSIAKTIADDRVRLDYSASSFGSAFVSNAEYGGSFDYTTLCKKRRIYTGTFSEIQKRLRNTALTADEILDLRNMLIAAGYEATCGLCYVEGSRAQMGKFAKEFINLYKRDNPGAWIPDMADVNTPDGVEQMRINHPEAYESYEYFWNHYGKLKDSDKALFASQQKPKLYESRKAYRNEIKKLFKSDSSIERKNLNGGIRMQSFSDFEIVHLIDTMQVIMDMSEVGLAGQAYTKVPEFAKAFGNTGLKINLSLIAKGVDENGRLIFDDREGMPHDTAFELRDQYSENVGTILVTFTDEQAFAAMADDRIDFIIPFHRSQWKKGQYNAMGLPKGTKDYTYVQNEKLIKKTYHEYRGRQVLDKAKNYMPNEYWDFSKSGKENAEAYLDMCAKNNKRPKFYKFLDYDGNGRYSLKADGSTDGYWKLLIDFKMYDNDGNGSPQKPVRPDFNMAESRKMLDEYKGGHQSYPVAYDVVDKFVDKYKSEHEGMQFSEETETSRDTLVSDMEAVAETDEEKSFVEKLKAEVEKANALQEELDEVNRKIKEASFTKGADKSVLPSLKEQKAQLVKKLNRLDSKFYGYRGYDTFKTLAERKSKDAVIAERLRGKEALRSQQQKYEEAAQSIKDTLAQREENRRRREIMRDIAKRLDAIDAKAKTDSKTKHIPSALRGVVAQFRMAVNTETQDYGKKIEAANESIEKYSKRLEKLNAALEEASAEEAAEIKERIDTVNAVIEQKQRAIENYKKYAVKANDYTDALTNFYNAYYEKSLENDYEKTYYADTEAVISAIEALKERIVGRSLYELNSEELQDVLDVTKMVQKSISNANKLFGETRSLADSVIKVADETEKYKALKKRRDKNLRPGEEKQKGKLGRTAEKLKYEMLKPAELFLQSGSDTLYGLYKKLQRAEGDAAKLIEKYGNKYRETAKENGVTKKQFDTKHRIDLDSGMTVELTSGELMTLYATSRRKQGRQHLLGGGFRLSGGIIREVRNGKVEELKSYLCKLTEADLKKISNELEDNLKKFTETMQGYMSDEMAKDGNRVSMQLYDVALFNDKFYIPLDVDDSTRPTSIEKGKGNIKIINKGMTQSLNEKAANGVYISNFSDVFAKHAQDMSSYAAFTLPLENLERVLNSSADGVRIKAIIGEDLSREIFDFLKDVNGGIKSDSVLTSRLFSLSKAARVGLNLRVIIQQPTAIIRAMSEIDPKYFFGTSTKGMSDTMKRKLLEEMHDYTSTWIVKSMGGVDLNTSKAISDQITDLGVRGNKLWETIPNGINKVSFFLAEKADQIAWMSLYAACKREARAQGFTGEYLLKRAGERFDEIVNKTQVYDSVFSRAKILRSQNWLNKLASMFMAEPLTTANMMMDAARLSSHGNSAKAARITASVALSIVITNAFAAIIDALRDDDDDETYGEKYLEAIIRNLMNDFDPATYIPYARDVISLAQGYDIERADMSLVADFITKGTNLIKAYKNGGELADSWHKFAGSILDVTGIPFSSLYRDAKAIVNTVFRGQGRKAGDSTKTNAALGSLDAFAGEIPGYALFYSPHSKSDKLYYAMVNGDDKYVKITKEEYADDEDKYNQLLKKGLKENDFRIAEAAQAHLDGDTEKYLELISEVVKDGYDEKIVQGAILAAENKLNGEDENVDRAIDGMLATKGDIISALEKGDSKYLNDYYEAKVKMYSSGEGKKDNPKKNALSATKAMLTDYYKPIYEEADSAERRRIRSILLKVKIDGKYLYDSSSFDNWDE